MPFAYLILDWESFIFCKIHSTWCCKRNSNKAHGHHGINIHMLKICGLSIYKPQEILLKQCGETGGSPSELERDNIVPIHKKETIKNWKNIQSCQELFLGKF